MNIEEILKAAGIEDAEAVAKVRELMPKAFIPLEDHNKRVAKAKDEAAAAAAALDEAQKAAAAAAEAAKAESGAAADESAKALAELQAKLEKLEGDYNASQAELKSNKASKAIEAALKAAGANPAALALLTSSAAGLIEFDEGGNPANVDEIAEQMKTANAGLFGEAIDTGKQPEAGQKPTAKDDFLAGFGATE